jgi:hypothetical protein
VRNSSDAAYEGITDLSTHKESAGGTAAARSYEIGEYRPVPGIEVDDALEVAEQTEVYRSGRRRLASAQWGANRPKVDVDHIISLGIKW